VQNYDKEFYFIGISDELSDIVGFLHRIELEVNKHFEMLFYTNSFNVRGTSREHLLKGKAQYS
jgi:hypothetical protein